MATSNFWTQNNWPLYAVDDSNMDWWEAQDFYNDVEERLADVNKGLRFFQIEVKSGYYCGAQFYITMTRDADDAGFTENGAEYADNTSTRDFLDMCLSEAKRKCEAEARKVCRLMKKIGAEYGFEEYIVTARFSNGETWYRKAADATKREQIKAALLYV